MIRRVMGMGAVAALAVGAMVLPSGAAETPLPTEFTSGGVRWGDLTNDTTGFLNDWGALCDADVYLQGDAFLIGTGQGDAFDGTGGVVINGEGYLVPPGTADAPVDLTGSKLTTASAPVGGLNVATEYYGLPGAPTLRYLVTLENPTGATVNTAVTLENNVGSDSNTFIQGSSSGQDTSYPTNERWFATSEGNTDPTGDPPILSVVTGPGAVRAPGTVAPCPEVNGDSQARNDEKAAAEAAAADDPSATEDAPEESAAPDGEVSAAGTDLDEDYFVYTYNVSIPPGETRYVMVYWSLYETIGESVAAGPAFNSTPGLGDALVAGLDQQTLCRVVNWDFGSCLSFTG
jgi:hypothetical protein